MIGVSVKLSSSGGVSGGGTRSLAGKAAFPLTFAQDQMRRGGQFALDTVKARIRRGIGSDDDTMPPLGFARHVKGRRLYTVDGYPAWKASKGLQPIRDMYGAGQGGHMLDNASVRSVSESSVKMAFTARLARAKAIVNERRTPFFSFSPADQKLIADWYAKEFGGAVEAIAELFKRKWKKKAA